MKDKLGNHIQQVRGVSYKPNDLSETLSDGYITLLRANNISEGKINFDSVQFVSSSKVSLEQILKTNDILVCSSSGSLSLVGKSALYKKTGEHTFGAFCKVVRATGKLLPQYIAFYMCSQAYRRHIENIANGANINNLRNEHLDDILLPIPSETKQNAIITKLEKVESVISHRRTQLAKLDELVKCRFVELFGEPLEVLKQGKTQALGTLVKEITVGYVGEAASAYTDIGIPYLRTQNVRRGYIDFAGLIYVTELFHTNNTKSKVSPGDVVISRVGVNRGMAAKIPDSLPEANIANCLIIKKSDAFNSDYLIFYLNLSYGKHPQFGASVGSAQGVINTAILKKWQVLQPELEQQNTFASFVRRIDKLRFVVESSHNHKHFTICGLVYLYANLRLNLKSA